MKFSIFNFQFSINLLLVGIIILFLSTRLYKISEIPASVYWDEASIGYNAYSVLKTGRDEWGKFLPIHFRAFGEFKLPVYIYTTAFFVKIFGLNEFSVRIPSVLFSLGVVLITYLLAKRWLDNETMGLFASFFVTISPWFFIFSRTGYEATAGLMFYLLAIYLFLTYTQSRWLLLFSILSFILSAYSYNSFRIIAPATLAILILHEINNLRIGIRKLAPAWVLSVVLLIASVFPVYRLYAYDVGNFRLQAVGIKSGAEFFTNYLSHFNPHFLFISGDNNVRSQQANFGQLYFPDLILIVVGLVYLISRKSKYGFLTLLLLLIGPIPAALTKESPHALRALSSSPFYAVLSANGVFYIRKFLKVKYFETIAVIIFLGFFMQYFFNFINVYPVLSSKDWQYGYKKIYMDYGDEFRKYDKIIISDEYAQPYIFVLFYLKYSPEKFQKEAIRNTVDQWGFSTVAKFDKFEFGKTDKLVKSDSKSTLIFATEKDSLTTQQPDDLIKFLDGSTAFLIYKL